MIVIKCVFSYFKLSLSYKFSSTNVSHVRSCPEEHYISVVFELLDFYMLASVFYINVRLVHRQYINTC